jgi:hypothetical protein
MFARVGGVRAGSSGYVALNYSTGTRQGAQMPESDYGYHQYWDAVLSHWEEQGEIGEFEAGSILIFALYDDLRDDFRGKAIIDIARDPQAYETAHHGLTQLVQTTLDTVHARTHFANIAHSHLETAQAERDSYERALEDAPEDDNRRDDFAADLERAKGSVAHWTLQYESAVADLERMKGLPTSLYEVVQLLEHARSDGVLAN